MRTDVIRTYKDIHSWVGIISGLALFIAFYAGAITMFEEQLQRWASPPTVLADPPPLSRTPELVEKTLAAHPEAARSYTIHVATGPERPARLSWTTGGRGDHGPRHTYYASLAPDGGLQVVDEGPSPVAQFVDVLHQQVGLPFEHEISMPIMGAIALLYAIALVSGTIVLIPSLVKDLFAFRIGANLKRMWLDLHNVLGLFSLPFHIVMALTAVVFAFHDQFYDAQGAVARLGAAQTEERERPAADPRPVRFAAPADIVARLAADAPGFTVTAIIYQNGERGAGVRVGGYDDRYGMRGPTGGFVSVDPETGAIDETDYMPGLQNGWYATVTSFFALHFGNYGGAPIRWSYFILGLAGAFLFYSGNLIWIESRRKKARKAGLPDQTRSSHVLGALTTGVSLGCIAGISITIAAAKWLPGRVDNLEAWHGWIYYGVFLAAIGWGFLRGAARAGSELLMLCAAATALIPLTSLFAPSGWSHPDPSRIVDYVAIAGVAAFLLMAHFARKRATHGNADSIWARPKAAPVRESVLIES